MLRPFVPSTRDNYADYAVATADGRTVGLYSEEQIQALSTAADLYGRFPHKDDAYPPSLHVVSRAAVAEVSVPGAVAYINHRYPSTIYVADSYVGQLVGLSPGSWSMPSMGGRALP